MPTLSVAQVLSDVDLGITAGLADAFYTTLGGRDVLYALNRAEGRLHEISIGPDGSLTVVDDLMLSGGFAVGSDPTLALSATGAGPALMLTGLAAGAGAFVTLGPTGALGAQVSDATFGDLAAPVLFRLNRDDAIVNGRPGGGLDLYLAGPGGYQFADGIADTADTYLADVAGGTAFIDGGAPFVVAASASESGLTVLRADPLGTLNVVDSFGATEGLPVSTPSDITSIANGGTDRLVLASSGTSSLTILRVEADGSLWLEDHILDNLATRFQSITNVDALTVGDHAFVAAGGGDGGVSLFTLLPNGRMIHLGSVVDTAATTLFRVSSVSLAATPGTLNIVATSSWEAGITRLSYDLSSLGSVLVLDDGDPGNGSADDDQIIGTDLADTLAGGAGDDILFDGAGRDVLFGGAGADLFVFAQDGVSDRIEDFDIANDRLDLSAFDFLAAASQLTVTPTGNGANLSYRSEKIEIVSNTGVPLSAADFTTETILNLDRPSFLEISQSLQGGPLADTLNGGQGDDTITGGDGGDWLSGAGGGDLLEGGDGDDRIDGGADRDTLEGGAGGDTLAGAGGDDLIDGGAGHDVLYGDEFDWLSLG